MLPFCRHGYQLQGPLPSHARGRDAEGQAQGILETAGRDLPIVVAIASPSSTCCRSATNSPSAQPLPARTLCRAISAGSARARREASVVAGLRHRTRRSGLCARACRPRTRHSFHCLCCVCVLAGNTLVGLVLALMVLVLTPISSRWSAPACNHPIARHLSLGVRLPRARRGPNYRVRLRGTACGGPARLAWPALACVCVLASHPCRHQAVVSRSVGAPSGDGMTSSNPRCTRAVTACMLPPVAALRGAAKCPLVVRVDRAMRWIADVVSAVLGEHGICTLLGEVLREWRMARGLMGRI